MFLFKGKKYAQIRIYLFTLLMQHTDVNNQHEHDAALARQAIAGDRHAFTLLLERHGHSLLLLCRKVLGFGPEAEDTAQEAALAAWLAIARLREPERFGAWLLGIGANLARMALRRRRIVSLEAVADPERYVVLWNALPGPEEVAAARELHDTVVAALAELSPLSREAVIGFYLQGYSQAELAAILGVPVGTLKGRLVFGRRRLRERLGALADERRRSQLPQSAKEMQMQQPKFIRVTVDSVRMSTSTKHRVVVLREQEASRMLPIWIGPIEADAIASVLAGQQFPRPMTHDLSMRMLEPLGATIAQVRITRITDSTFFAEIVLKAGAAEYIIDARPSDALALAVRAAAPIYVASEVLDAAAVAEIADTEPIRREVPPQAIRIVLLGNTQPLLDPPLLDLLTMQLGVVEVIDTLPPGSDLATLLRTSPELIVLVNLSPGESLDQVAELRLQHANLALIVLGYDDPVLIAEAQQHAITHYLAKPVDADTLRSAVRDAWIAAQQRTK